MPRTFCRTPELHCSFANSENSVSVSIFDRGSVTCPQCPWHVPRRLFLLSGASRTRAWRLPGVGGAPGRPRRRVLRRPRPRYSRQGARTAAQRRSAPPIAPWLSAWPHARQRTTVAQPPWPASTERDLCHRRARAITVPSSSPLTPKPRPV